MLTKFHGFLCVHKHIGESSYDVIRKIKKAIPEKKIGHAGTLDPFAEGLLIIAIGRHYTKQISTFQDMPKRYQFTLSLGTSTDSLDSTGTVIERQAIPSLSEEQIKDVLSSFIGSQEQMPPAFSAKKINGKPAYKLAREGKEVSLKPSHITIHELNLISASITNEFAEISCDSLVSKGTYIRSLSADIAKKLNTVGHTNALIRTHIGEYETKQALSSSDITQENILKVLKK